MKPLAILERNDLIELALQSSVSGGNKILSSTVTWLDEYFSGKNPDIKIPLYFAGTDFQKEVWEILCKIPYGKTMSYAEISKEIALKRGIKKMSAQAVGNAVGKNPISIICPCHRVIGSDGSMTGYAWGIDVKIKLLELEKIIASSNSSSTKS
ncbi:MAG: methylated-DNA--[protein]-cysteine S-methyltransferase [Treponema sp.]|nr:methylated-DNA--[protein]-cysteine S-methyltransferase [Treponema sp.]